MLKCWQEKDNYRTLGLKWRRNGAILWQKYGRSWINMWQCLDILMLKLGQNQDIIYRLQTGQHTELRIHFAAVIYDELVQWLVHLITLLKGVGMKDLGSTLCNGCIFNRCWTMSMWQILNKVPPPKNTI